MSSASKKLMLILFSTSISLAICEAALRLQGHKYSGSTYTADPLPGWSLMNNSILLQLVYKLRRAYAQQKEMAQVSMDGKNTASAGPNAPPPEYQRYLTFLPPAIPPMVEAWQVTEALIVEIGHEVRSHHLPLLIMAIPTIHQIHPDPREREAYRAKYKIESLEYADDRVEQHARANGIPVLRLSKPIIEEATRTGTSMVGFANTAPNEGHFNELGHIVIARELVRAICEIASLRK